jgi:hypothetical protein
MPATLGFLFVLAFALGPSPAPQIPPAAAPLVRCTLGNNPTERAKLEDAIKRQLKIVAGRQKSTD